MGNDSVPLSNNLYFTTALHFNTYTFLLYTHRAQLMQMTQQLELAGMSIAALEQDLARKAYTLSALDCVRQ